MHTHISLWKGDKPLFAGNGYAGLSDTALFFIGGILKHAPALTCITNPTTNSYKRLVPGFEAPVNLAYSARNRSAAIRIPTYSANPKSKRIEFRTPDPAANPYLAFSALLLAGLDGIQSRIDPGDPLDKNLYDLPPEELANVPSVPDSLRGRYGRLGKGPRFPPQRRRLQFRFHRELAGDETKGIRRATIAPHPYEFSMYYDV
jgi:glutamine synthetase